MASRPGIRTTEFWLTLVSNVVTIATIAADILPSKYGVPLLAGVNVVYVVMRTLIKEPSITTFSSPPYPPWENRTP